MTGLSHASVGLQITKRIMIPLVDTKSYEKVAKFKVLLTQPTGVKAALGQYTECVVEIVADNETKKLVDTVLQKYQQKMVKYQVRKADSGASSACPA